MAQKIKLAYDLNDIDRSEGSEFVADGTYLAKIVKVKQAEARNEKKTPQLMVALKMLDCDREENKQYIGAAFADFVALTPEAAFRVAQLWDAAKGARTVGKEIDPDELLDKTLVVKIKTEEYQGNKRPKVERYFPAANWRKAASAKKPGDDVNLDSM